MKIDIKTAISCALVLFALAGHAQDSAPSQADKGVGSYTTETARVESVLRVEDDGYRSVTYVVVWKGKRIGVEDPLSTSDHHIGEVIEFMVSRWHPSVNPEPKVLRFTLLELHVPKPSSK